MTYISGRVFSHEGKPLRWVGVILDPNSRRKAVTLTNKEGRFAFRTTPEEHTLAVRNFALRPWTKIFVVPRRGVENLEIKLEPSLRMLDYPPGRGGLLGQ